MEFKCNFNHTAIARPGVRLCGSLFEQRPYSTEKTFSLFLELSPDRQNALRELFRKLRWWKRDMWQESEETLLAFTREEQDLFKIAGFKEAPSVAPPRKVLDEYFQWGVLRCVFKQASKSSSPVSDSFVLCVQDHPSWRLGDIEQNMFFVGHFALAYFGHDFMSLRCAHVLTDRTLIASDAAHDMCYLVNSLLKQYNTGYSFSYKSLKALGTQLVSLELFGFGEVIADILVGFKALRSLLPKNSTNVGVYRFLTSYSHLSGEDKHSLFVMSNLLHESAITQSAIRLQKFPDISERRCIVCLLPCIMNYEYTPEICFCSLSCLRCTIGPVLDVRQSTEARKRSKHIQ